MTLGEKIASARKEKGMTQEMLAEQLGVTRQAVARWETGKALPGTANLFMLRQLLGIPLEAADMEATDLEGTTGTEKSGTLANTEKAESLTAKQEVQNNARNRTDADNDKARNPREEERTAAHIKCVRRKKVNANADNRNTKRDILAKVRIL